MDIQPPEKMPNEEDHRFEERCRQLLEACGDMMTVHERGGALTYVSPSSDVLLGYSPKEMVGHSIFDFLFSEDVRNARAGFSRLLQKPRSYTMTYRIRKKDASVAWFETVLSPVFDEKGRVFEIVGVSRDISHRKRTEEAIRANEKQLKRIANATPILLWLADTEGRCVFFNESWLKFTGRNMQDACGYEWMKSVHEGDIFRIRKNYRRHAHALQPFSHEYRLRDSKGKYRWVLEKAVPRFSDDSVFEGYLGTCIDVSELKSAQQELRAKNKTLQQFKFAFDSIPDHMIITDREGIVLYANEAAARMTGYTQDEIVGKKHGSRELWGGLMTQEYYRRLWTTIKKEKTSFVGKIYNRRKDGTRYWAEIRIHPLLGTNLGVKYYVTTERVIPDAEGEPHTVAQPAPEKDDGKGPYVRDLFDGTKNR